MSAAQIGDFNSHTREGVTAVGFGYKEIYLYFNSHTREGVTCMMSNFVLAI